MGAPTRYSPEEDEIFLTKATIAEVNEALAELGQPPVTADAWQGRKRVLRAKQDGEGLAGLFDRFAKLGKEQVKLTEARERIDSELDRVGYEMEQLKGELGL